MSIGRVNETVIISPTTLEGLIHKQTPPNNRETKIEISSHYSSKLDTSMEEPEKIKSDFESKLFWSVRFRKEKFTTRQI